MILHSVQMGEGSPIVLLHGLFGSVRNFGAVQKALADPAVLERFSRLGIEITTASPDEFQKILRADWDAAGQIVKASGARIE